MELNSKILHAKVREMSRALEIYDISLHSNHATVYDASLAVLSLDPSMLTLEVRWATDSYERIELMANKASPEGEYRFFHRLILNTHARYLSAKTDESIAAISASFSVVFKSKSDLNDCDDITWKLFSDTRVSFEMWPYWRQYLAEHSQKMRLPVIQLPLYTIDLAKKLNSSKRTKTEIRP